MVHLMAEIRENVKQLPESPSDSGRIHHIGHRRRDDCHVSFLAFSMRLFLCITASLTMITVISDFALTYETRGLLLDLADQLSNMTVKQDSEIPITSTTTGDTTDTTPTFTTTEAVRSTSVAENISPSTTESFPSTTINSELTTTAQSSMSESSTSSATSTTLEPIKKRSPVEILNEFHSGNDAKYTCTKVCSDPPIITAQLNIALSASSQGDNFLILTRNVSASEVGVAKREIAHFALKYLYKEQLERCNFNQTGSPPNTCNVSADKLFPNCK